MGAPPSFVPLRHLASARSHPSSFPFLPLTPATIVVSRVEVMPNCTLDAFPLLVTDASSVGAQVGIMGRDGWMAFHSERGATSKTLFASVQRLLAETGLHLGDLHGFIFCEGPGSTMGIRINCMALRTWVWLNADRPSVYAYKSLEAMALIQSDRMGHPFAIFSDLRTDRWNAIRVDAPGQSSPVQAVTSKDLENWPDTRYHLHQRVYSPALPPGSQLLPYDIEPLQSPNHFTGLIRRVRTPKPFQTTETTFKKWVPQRHKGAGGAKEIG